MVVELHVERRFGALLDETRDHSGVEGRRHDAVARTARDVEEVGDERVAIHDHVLVGGDAVEASGRGVRLESIEHRGRDERHDRHRGTEAVTVLVVVPAPGVDLVLILVGEVGFVAVGDPMLPTHHDRSSVGPDVGAAGEDGHRQLAQLIGCECRALEEVQEALAGLDLERPPAAVGRVEEVCHARRPCVGGVHVDIDLDRAKRGADEISEVAADASRDHGAVELELEVAALLEVAEDVLGHEVREDEPVAAAERGSEESFGVQVAEALEHFARLEPLDFFQARLALHRVECLALGEVGVAVAVVIHRVEVPVLTDVLRGVPEELREPLVKPDGVVHRLNVTRGAPLRADARGGTPRRPGANVACFDAHDFVTGLVKREARHRTGDSCADHANLGPRVPTRGRVRFHRDFLLEIIARLADCRHPLTWGTDEQIV